MTTETFDYLTPEQMNFYLSIKEAREMGPLNHEQRLLLRLQRFDWSWQHSDCSSTRAAERATQEELIKAIKESGSEKLQEALPLFEQYYGKAYEWLAQFSWLKGWGYGGEGNTMPVSGVIACALAGVANEEMVQLKQALQEFAELISTLGVAKNRLIFTSHTPSIPQINAQYKRTGDNYLQGISVASQVVLSLNALIKRHMVAINKVLAKTDDYLLLDTVSIRRERMQFGKISYLHFVVQKGGDHRNGYAFFDWHNR